MLTAVGLAVSVGIGRSGNDQGKQKPGAAEKDCKGKKNIRSGNLEMDKVQ